MITSDQRWQNLSVFTYVNNIAVANNVQWNMSDDIW